MQITADFREFTAKNKMAGMAKGGEVSLAEMSEALRSMPQFKTQVSQMSLHLAMCGRCFELQPDQEVGMLEQNMAMGEDENGKTFSDAVNSIMKIYRTPPARFNDEQKLRLLLICCISQNGLSESERAKLFKMSGLDQGRDNQMMTNLSNLGIQLQKQKARIFQRSKKPERRKVGGSAAPDWALFRFRPQNYFICQDVIDSKLRSVSASRFARQFCIGHVTLTRAAVRKITPSSIQQLQVVPAVEVLLLWGRAPGGPNLLGTCLAWVSSFFAPAHCGIHRFATLLTVVCCRREERRENICRRARHFLRHRGHDLQRSALGIRAHQVEQQRGASPPC